MPAPSRISCASLSRCQNRIDYLLTTTAHVSGSSSGPRILPPGIVSKRTQIEQPVKQLLKLQFEVREKSSILEIGAHLIGEPIAFRRSRQLPRPSNTANKVEILRGFEELEFGLLSFRGPHA